MIGMRNAEADSYKTKMWIQVVEETFGERSEKVVLYEKEVTNIGLSG
jgi:hypothetical protein